MTASRISLEWLGSSIDKDIGVVKVSLGAAFLEGLRFP
jgi:hypothetical protein